MEQQIQHLNALVSEKMNNYVTKKQTSGCILMNILHYQIGQQFCLPKDMTYEISLYLVYNTKSLLYKEMYQRNFYVFLKSEILKNSLHVLTRYRDINDDSFGMNWYVYEYIYFSNCRCKIVLMSATNCSICGNYINSRYATENIICHCFDEDVLSFLEHLNK